MDEAAVARAAANGISNIRRRSLSAPSISFIERPVRLKDDQPLNEAEIFPLCLSRDGRLGFSGVSDCFQRDQRGGNFKLGDAGAARALGGIQGFGEGFEIA